MNRSRIEPTLGSRDVNKLTVADASGLVSELHDAGLARETIRKSLSTLKMALDFAGVQPNPARDKSIRLPREDVEELTPPTAAHLLAVHGFSTRRTVSRSSCSTRPECECRSSRN